MTDILQIFKTAIQIEKPDYNTKTRQAIGNWDSVSSKTGYLSDTTLFLPTDCKQNPAVKNADLLIIQDIYGFDPFTVDKSLDSSDWFTKSTKERLLADNLQLKAFTILSKPWTFELFEFKRLDNDNVEIWFNYADSIGIPKRQNHKIAELKKGQSIRYKVNGKDDFTMTGRKQRTFSEYDFVFHFIGTANKIEFKNLNKIVTTKTIPKQDSKLIDERKILT